MSGQRTGGNDETLYLLKEDQESGGGSLEISAAAVVAVLAHLICYLCICFEERHEQLFFASMLGPIGLTAMAMVLILVARNRYTKGYKSRFLVVTGLALLTGVTTGCVTGEMSYRMYTGVYYGWKEMASYVNVDPAIDKGQSYMDAAVLYFKEGSFVQGKKALAFHNGATYCIAPILRQSLEVPHTLESATPFHVPRSGSVDFWAVGKDCCGDTGTDISPKQLEGFSCGDSLSPIARSGLRLLDGTERDNYLLATQQWSATTGMPVKHPIFVNWVQDPWQTQRDTYAETWNRLWNALPIALVVSVSGTFFLSTLLQWLELA